MHATNRYPRTETPLARSMRAVMSHEGETDGMGYAVKHVKPGRGFSCTEYAVKELANGQSVERCTHYPGPFDGAAGLSSEITEMFSVWVGWEPYSALNEALYDAPPEQLALPQGAVGWTDRAWDGPRHWFAEFADQEAAEVFAASLPRIEGDDVPPLRRRAKAPAL